MKRHFVAFVFSFTLITATATRAQAPAASDERTLLALIKEIQTQQAQITENQAKIDAKLAEIADTLRVARIFTSREK
jgi:cell division protein FtsL